MEPIINRTDASVPSRQVPQSPPKESEPTPTPSAPSQSSKIEELAQKAAASGPDLRADEIERAKRLVADPNYPSDDILEKLADGLIQSEDFRGAV